MYFPLRKLKSVELFFYSWNIIDKHKIDERFGVLEELKFLWLGD
jgi:hypothetical protein